VPHIGRWIARATSAAGVMRLTNLSFEEWIEHAFSQEVRIQQAAWSGVLPPSCSELDSSEDANLLMASVRIYGRPYS
jgi:hypothetical protein